MSPHKYYLLLVTALIVLGCGRPKASSVTTNTDGIITTPDLVFNLIDATSGNTITVITNKSTIAASDVVNSTTILVTGPANIKSIFFTFDGNKSYHVDRSYPFTATDGDSPPYTAMTLHQGSHILTAKSYDDTDGNGLLVESQSVVFSISGS